MTISSNEILKDWQQGLIRVSPETEAEKGLAAEKEAIREFPDPSTLEFRIAKESRSKDLISEWQGILKHAESQKWTNPEILDEQKKFLSHVRGLDNYKDESDEIFEQYTSKPILDATFRSKGFRPDADVPLATRIAFGIERYIPGGAVESIQEILLRSVPFTGGPISIEILLARDKALSEFNEN